MRKFVTVLLVGLSHFVYANSEWQKVCESIKAITDENVIEGNMNCDAEALYYGIGMNSDPIEARHCALRTKKDSPVFGGDAILMMIYANGFGVERDLNRAIHYACRLEGSEMEMRGRIGHLQQLKAENWQGHNFDLCDDITSGAMMGACTAHFSRMEEVERDKRFLAISQKVPSHLKNLFDKLKSASDDFIKTRSRKEIDLSGTARVMFIINEENILRKDFVEMLEAFANGKSRQYTVIQFRDRDAKLEKILTIIQAKKSKNDVYQGYECASQSDCVQQTQKKWVIYRDSFAAYAAAQNPKVKEYSVKAWLTIKRIHMLQNFQ